MSHSGRHSKRQILPNFNLSVPPPTYFSTRPPPPLPPDRRGLRYPQMFSNYESNHRMGYYPDVRLFVPPSNMHYRHAGIEYPRPSIPAYTRTTKRVQHRRQTYDNKKENHQREENKIVNKTQNNRVIEPIYRDEDIKVLDDALICYINNSVSNSGLHDKNKALVGKTSADHASDGALNLVDHTIDENKTLAGSSIDGKHIPPMFDNGTRHPIVRRAEPFFPPEVEKDNDTRHPIVRGPEQFFPPEVEKDNDTRHPIVRGAEQFFPREVEKDNDTRHPIVRGPEQFFPPEVEKDNDTRHPIVRGAEQFFPREVEKDNDTRHPIVRGPEQFFPPEVEKDNDTRHPIVRGPEQFFPPEVEKDNDTRHPIVRGPEQFFPPEVEKGNDTRHPIVRGPEQFFPPEVEKDNYTQPEDVTQTRSDDTADLPKNMNQDPHRDFGIIQPMSEEDFRDLPRYDQIPHPEYAPLPDPFPKPSLYTKDVLDQLFHLCPVYPFDPAILKQNPPPTQDLENILELLLVKSAIRFFSDDWACKYAAPSEQQMMEYPGMQRPDNMYLPGPSGTSQYGQQQLLHQQHPQRIEFNRNVHIPSTQRRSPQTAPQTPTPAPTAHVGFKKLNLVPPEGVYIGVEPPYNGDVSGIELSPEMTDPIRPCANSKPLFLRGHENKMQCSLPHTESGSSPIFTNPINTEPTNLLYSTATSASNVPQPRNTRRSLSPPYKDPNFEDMFENGNYRRRRRMKRPYRTGNTFPRLYTDGYNVSHHIPLFSSPYPSSYSRYEPSPWIPPVYTHQQRAATYPASHETFKIQSLPPIHPGYYLGDPAQHPPPSMHGLNFHGSGHHVGQPMHSPLTPTMHGPQYQMMHAQGLQGGVLQDSFSRRQTYSPILAPQGAHPGVYNSPIHGGSSNDITQNMGYINGQDRVHQWTVPEGNSDNAHYNPPSPQ